MDKCSMKDKKRIKRIIRKFEEIWLENSDLRFGQLYTNIINHLNVDAYYLDDNRLEAYLDTRRYN